MKKTVKKYLVFLTGLLVFSFGISFANKSLLGANAMAVMVVGISLHLPLTIGTCNLIVGLIQLAIGFCLDRKDVTWATLIGVVCGSYGIDLANLIIPNTDDFYIRILYMTLGLLLYCLGLAIEQTSKCGYGQLDCMMFGLARIFKIKKYRVIRWVVDGFFIITGYLLGSVVSFGCILYFVATGILIERFRTLLTIMLKNYLAD